TYKEHDFVITTVTPTGSDRVQQIFGNSVFHLYLPYDLSGAVKRFLKKIKPDLAVVMETEIWPNLFRFCKKRNIPIVVANARLSELSLKGYKWVQSLATMAVNNTKFVAAQTQTDADRMIRLGCDADKIYVVGSLKFDIIIEQDIIKKGQAIHKHVAQNHLIWIAASTHQEDELELLEAYSYLKKKHPSLLLIIVPRHPERFQVTTQACIQKGFNTQLRSKCGLYDIDADVFIVDTMGEMLEFYAASDIAFVGGSIANIGGHNVLEAAVFKLPVFLLAQKLHIIEKEISSKINIINDLKVEQNTLWLATGSGLFCLENNTIKSFKFDKKGNLLKINTLEIDHSGNKWLGTYSGELIKFNKGEILSSINFNKYLDNENTIITDIAISKSEQEIILSTATGRILYYNLLNGATGLIESPVKNTMIYSINYGANKNIWLCSADGFYTKQAKGKWKKQQGLYLAYGIFNQAGNYWAIGRSQNKKALFMLYYKHESLSGAKYVWKEFKLNKLPNQYTRFYELVADDEYAWITSDSGLIKYDVSTGNILLIDKYHGIDLKKIRHIAAQSNGKLWMSTAGNKLYKLEKNNK
ncbi:MAG: hypothetical protein L3J74_03810, partial [Bacteroidales bacterium]|nr:hypothetical protein [Bacteroidales bacterium]